MPIDFAVGDVIRLRKAHPCGGFDWTVVRVGADIGLRCVTCGRRIMLGRSTVEQRFRSFVERPGHREPFGPRALEGLDVTVRSELPPQPPRAAGPESAEPPAGGAAQE